MKRPRRNRPEDGLQRAVMDFLDLALPADALAWHVPNGGHRNAIEAKILKGMGVRAGIPDVHVVHGGRLLCIELKRPPAVLNSGKLSKAKPATSGTQEEMHARLRAAGVAVCVAQSVERVESFLAEHGVPLRGRVRLAR